MEPSPVTTTRVQVGPGRLRGVGLAGLATAVVLVVAMLVPAASADVPTDRLAGPDRFGTAVEVSRHQFPDGAATVYLARSHAPFVDALVGGTLTDGPILLVPGCGGVPEAVATEISRVDPDSVVALGGERAICEDTLADAAADRPTDRLAGPDRYGTAVEVSRHQFPDGAQTLYLARSREPLVDALAGGAVTDGPVLLVPGCGEIPEVVTAEIARIDPEWMYALGGDHAICEDTVTMAAAGRDLFRLAGPDRFATAVAIARHAFRSGTQSVYLARSHDPLVDALAGGVLTNGPVLLVPGCGPVPDEVTDAVRWFGPRQVVALGGSRAICDTTLAEVAHEDPVVCPVESPTIPMAECEALVSLYRATDGPGWSVDDGWNTDTDPCTWHGVTCGGDAVTLINLDSNGLSGPVPGAIANLTHLEVLLLYDNDVSALPPEIGDLQALEVLGLAGNLLGSLPPEIGGLTNLMTLDLGGPLSGNPLGSLPPEIGDLENLRSLSLTGNQLRALPPEIGGLAQLRSLHLDQNFLTSLPAELADLFNLELLYLPDNQLTGDITDWAMPMAAADTLDSLAISDGTRGNNCLTVTDPTTGDWLTGKDASWDECD